MEHKLQLLFLDTAYNAGPRDGARRPRLQQGVPQVRGGLGHRRRGLLPQVIFSQQQ